MFSFNSRNQLVIPQLIIPATMQYRFGGAVGTIFFPNTLFLTRISNDGELPTDIDLVGTTSYASKAIQSEAKTYTSAINRSQQAFFLEKGYLAKNLTELAIGISSRTENYSYQIVVLDDKKGVQSFGLALKDGLKSYTGLVYPKATLAVGEGTTLFSLLCESKKPTKARPSLFKLTPEPICPEGYVLLKY